MGMVCSKLRASSTECTRKGTAFDPGLEQVVTAFDGDQVQFIDMASPGLGIELMQVHESTSRREPRMRAHFLYRLAESTSQKQHRPSVLQRTGGANSYLAQCLVSLSR